MMPSDNKPSPEPALAKWSNLRIKFQCFQYMPHPATQGNITTKQTVNPGIMNTIHTFLYFVSSYYVTQIEPISFRIIN